jgi:ABC-type transport system substrate-binding protein
LGEKSFVVPLGESDSDRYRLYCETERGQVIVFRVQYEAFMNGEWRPIVRYGTAHGFPHRDLLHHNRPGEKTEYPGWSNAEVLTLGQEDIKRNWQAYRAEYEKEMSK